MLLPLAASSQEEAFYVEFKNESFAEAFTKIEHTYDVLFSYNDYDISKKRISLKRQKNKLLLLATIKTNLKYLEVVGLGLIMPKIISQKEAECQSMAMWSIFTKVIKN